MKKSKRLIGVLLAVIILLVSIQAAFVAGAAEANSIKVATISDIRYQSGATDKEGLLLSKSAAMLDAAIAKVKNSNADVLLVTGDLTNNGSKSSHNYVAEKLAEVEAEGIPVYVIPGEHDVREGGTLTAVSKSVFEEIYKDFGYSESKQDPNSASYVADLGNGFEVVMSDSVAADGQGQMTQWVVDQAKSGINSGKTVFAASHHPIVTRSSVDRIFIDLLHTLSNVELELGGKFKIYTNDPDQAAASLGLVDRTCVLNNSGALLDAGVKYLFSGHGGTLSVSGTSTTNGAQLYDIMSGSLVNASASVRYTTLYKGTDNMKQQRAEYTTDMITSAQGVDNVEQAAHAALKAYMPTEVDNAISTAEKVIAHLIPAIKPNIQNVVRNLDFAALGVSIPSIADGIVQDVKNDLASSYVGPLFDILGNSTKLHNIITDLRSALEAMDFNGQDLYGFLTDVFITIQKGDGKTPASVEGIFEAIRNKEPEMLVGLINSFADNFDPTNFVNLLNEVLDLRFNKSYAAGIAKIDVQLRPLLAGPYKVVSVVDPIDLWGILDGAVTLPGGKTVSSVVRPLVNDLILGGPNDPTTKQTPQRFTQNLKANAEQIVNLLFDFGVGDLIGTNVFAQGQKGAVVARTITFEEFSANLDRLIPNNDVTALNPADWDAVRDVLNAAGRFTAEQLASVNDVLVPATDTDPAVTQLDKLNELANAEFYKGVADAFTVKVNALPATGSLTLDNAAEVYALQLEYDQFYSEIKANISEDTVAKLNAAVAKIRSLENYDPAVDAVIEKINAIGKVTVDSEAAIKEARDAYNALELRQKKLVTNYDVLVAAEAALEAAKENAVIIKAVEDKIAAIGEVTYTSASKIKIDLARAAYDALDDELKASVSNYEVLTAAEARYAELKAEQEDAAAVAPVIAKINAIGKVTINSKALIEAAEAAYAELTESQKALVTNYDVLVAARAAYDELVQAEQGDKAAAQAVIDKINAIGTVTLESEAAIAQAREAYDKLTPAQKTLVTNYAVLTNAEATYAALVKQQADEAAAKSVEELIDAIGEVTIEKEDQITAARDAYNALTSDQKRLVSNLSVLTDAEAQLSVLKNDFLFEDAATGITLRADSGVLPADTVMTVKSIVSGGIYDAILAKGYSAIRLYDIALTSGDSEAVPSKAVRISVPQFAANTAVFAVSEDGTLTPVEAVLENGVFTFTSDDAGMFVVAQSKVYVNTEALEAAIAAFEKLNPSEYDEIAFAKADAAYRAAKAELEANYELTAANQRKIDAATAALNDAVAALCYLPADISQLNTALYAAKMLNTADYLDFTAVAKAIAAAEDFLAGEYDIRDQAEVDKLAKDINDAVAALKFAPADFTAIDNALAKVPKDLQNYTDESVAALNEAVNAAKEAKNTITREDKDWEAKVEAYAQAVLDAIAGLEKPDVTYADTSMLEMAIEIAALYNPSDYVDFSGVEAAIIAAQTLLDSKPTADRQAEVDAAEMAIYDAIAVLEWA